jgi:hypothetical protein
VRTFHTSPGIAKTRKGENAKRKRVPRVYFFSSPAVHGWGAGDDIRFFISVQPLQGRLKRRLAGRTLPFDPAPEGATRKREKSGRLALRLPAVNGWAGEKAEPASFPGVAENQTSSLGAIRIAPVCAAVALFLLLFSTPAPAQTAPPPSTDDELLKNLGADPVDDYDRELFGGGKQNAKPPGKGDDLDRLKEQLKRELGEAAKAEDDKPLVAIARRMREVQPRLLQNDAGPGTQKLQQQIAADLERLIQEARKSACQMKPGQEPQQAVRTPIGPSKPNSRPKPGTTGQTNPKPVTAPDTGPRKPEARQVDMAEMHDVIKHVWGELLPPPQREQMLQLAVEDFLYDYRFQIEDYFRKLSERKAKNEK